MSGRPLVRQPGHKASRSRRRTRRPRAAPKPAPDLFLAARRKFDLPAATAVVGDTPYDVRAGHAARLPVFAVLTGGFPRASLRRAERIYPRIGDLLPDLVWAVR